MVSVDCPLDWLVAWMCLGELFQRGLGKGRSLAMTVGYISMKRKPPTIGTVSLSSLPSLLPSLPLSFSLFFPLLPPHPPPPLLPSYYGVSVLLFHVLLTVGPKQALSPGICFLPAFSHSSEDANTFIPSRVDENNGMGRFCSPWISSSSFCLGLWAFGTPTCLLKVTKPFFSEIGLYSLSILPQSSRSFLDSLALVSWGSEGSTGNTEQKHQHRMQEAGGGQVTGGVVNAMLQQMGGALSISRAVREQLR